MIRRLLPVALLVLACSGLQPGTGPGATPQAPSGIRGTVILGPTCPTGSAPGAHDPVPCLTPYSAQLVVLDARDQVVARVTSQQDGTFEVDLAPGDYVIAPQSGDPYPIAQPVPVAVSAGSYTRIEINYDTGIR